MGKRANTVDTAVLAIEVLRRIPRCGRIDAPTLHQKLLQDGFDRQIRTIQRQLEMLCQHFEIERDERCKPYGYRWVPGAGSLVLPALRDADVPPRHVERA